LNLTFQLTSISEQERCASVEEPISNSPSHFDKKLPQRQSFSSAGTTLTFTLLPGEVAETDSYHRFQVKYI